MHSATQCSHKTSPCALTKGNWGEGLASVSSARWMSLLSVNVRLAAIRSCVRASSGATPSSSSPCSAAARTLRSRSLARAASCRKASSSA